MGNYAVRIYDPALKTFVQCEAARRHVRESEVVADAVRHLMEGSDAPHDEVSTPAARAVRRRIAPDRPAAPADAVAGEAVVQPVPPVDPRAGLDAALDELNAVTRREIARGEREDLDRTRARAKGPDSGPDDELGF